MASRGAFVQVNIDQRKVDSFVKVTSETQMFRIMQAIEERANEIVEAARRDPERSHRSRRGWDGTTIEGSYRVTSFISSGNFFKQQLVNDSPHSRFYHEGHEGVEKNTYGKGYPMVWDEPGGFKNAAWSVSAASGHFPEGNPFLSKAKDEVMARFLSGGL